MSSDTAYIFSMLGALFLLFWWVVYSVTSRAYRRKLSIFGRGPIFRCAIWGLLIIGACFQFYYCWEAVGSGKIYESLGGGFHTSYRGYTFYRATSPNGFWAWVCAEYYFGIMLLYVFIAEMIVIVRSKKAKQRSSA
jgi:hypothetical protein